MVPQGNPFTVAQVPCEVCLKEVPKSEAKVAEGTDYVLYFCGLECYAKWTTENEKSKQQSGTAGS